MKTSYDGRPAATPSPSVDGADSPRVRLAGGRREPLALRKKTPLALERRRPIVFGYLGASLSPRLTSFTAIAAGATPLDNDPAAVPSAIHAAPAA
jgi:hypothetical protein